MKIGDRIRQNETHSFVDIPGIKETLPGEAILHRRISSSCSFRRPNGKPMLIPMNTWYIDDTTDIMATLDPGNVLDVSFNYLPSFKPTDRARQWEVKVKIRKE